MENFGKIKMPTAPMAVLSPSAPSARRWALVIKK
jgi:hypothetical protein